MNLQDKTAVVTGGGTGIGLAIAKRFAAEGAHVFITGRRKEVLDDAVAEIGGSVQAIRARLLEPRRPRRASTAPSPSAGRGSTWSWPTPAAA